MKLIIATSLLILGCTIAGESPTEDKHMQCKDMRDNEQFAFSSTTITDVRIGLAGGDSCFTITDDSSQTRTLCKSHELFIKCVEDHPDD